MLDFKVIELSSEEAAKILTLEEDWTMDIKGKKIEPSKLSCTVSAFANATGGEIYIGISHGADKTEYFWDGHKSMEEYNQIIDIIASICPGYDDCSFEYCKCAIENTYVLHVTIQKTQRVIYATNNKPYLRIGAQNISTAKKYDKRIHT